jgi:GNAT superfamily N-acetyltransferase
MDIQVSRALPAEYPVIVNNLPQEWFGDNAHLLYLQVAEMVNSNRFLIAHAEDQLVGGLGWQNDVAFGAYYEKFLYVKPEYRRHGVAALLWRELAKIAMDTGQRAVFADVPDGSPLVRAVLQVPGAREVGSIESFHSDGVKSRIFMVDLSDADKFMSHVDRIAEAAQNLSDL